MTVAIGLESTKLTPSGSKSVTTTFLAVDVPLLVTTTVYAAPSPPIMLIGQVLSTEMSGESTSLEHESSLSAVPFPPSVLVVVAFTEFVRIPAVTSTSTLIVIVIEAFTSISPKSKVSS